TSVRVRIPDTMARDALGTGDVDRVVGTKLSTAVHLGHLLSASDLASQTVSLSAGRAHLAIAWDPPVGASTEINSGDTVNIYATPRQGADAATLVIDHAKVVKVGRADSAVASGTGSFAANTASARANSLVLDLDLDQTARLAAAAHTSTLDVVLVSATEDPTP